MSVFLEDDIIAAGKRPEGLLELGIFEAGSLLVYHDLAFYRAAGQRVTRKDIDQFPGHANVRDERGKRSGRTQTNLATTSQWLTPPPSAQSPGRGGVPE